MVTGMAQVVVDLQDDPQGGPTSPAMPTLMTNLINVVNDCRTAYGARKYGPHETYGPTTTIGSVHGNPAISLIHRTDNDGKIFTCFVQKNGGKQCFLDARRSPVLLMNVANSCLECGCPCCLF
jgi:hypothetical protein